MERDTDHRGQQPGKTKAGSKKKTNKQRSSTPQAATDARNNNRLATQCSSPGPIGHATTTAWQPSAQALAPLATQQQQLGNPVLKPWPHWPRNNNRLATQCASPGPIGHATTTAWHPSAQALAPLATQQQPLGNPVRKPWPHWPRNNNRLAPQCASPGPIGHATTTAWQPSAQALAPLATQQQPLGNPVHKPWLH